MRWSMAAGVGVVVVLAAAILVAAFVLLESAGVLGKTYTRAIEFKDAQGVTKGTDVRLAGVKIGEVDKIELAPDNRALLTLRILQKYPILEDYPLPTGTNIQIGSSGLLTAPIVEIIPGNVGPPHPGTLQGTAAPTLDQLLPNAQKLLVNLTDLTKSLQGIVGDRQLIANLKRSTANLADVSEQGKVIARNFQAASVSGREMAARFNQTSGHLNQTALMLRQTVAENRSRLGQTLTSVNDTMGAVHDLVGQLSSVVADPKLKNSLTGTLANLQQTTDNLKKLSANMEKLSSDRQVNEDLRATLSNVRATTEEMDRFFGRLNHIVGTGGSTTRGMRQKIEKTGVSVDLLEQANPGRARLDFNAYVPGGERQFYRLGVNDLTERNKLNLQLGERLPGGWGRFGLYSSRLGVGLDVGAPSHPHFSADLYSLARPELDLRARTGIGPGLDLTLGVLSAFHRNTPAVGVTMRR